MGKSNETTTKFKVDISELKAGIQEANRQIALANSEFKKASAGMERWADDADGLSAKLRQLRTVTEQYESILNELEQQYAKVVEEQGENSQGATDLKIKMNALEAAIKNNNAAIGKYENRLNEMNGEISESEKEMKNAEKAADKLGNEVEDAGKKARDAGDGFSVFKGALADLLADGIRATVEGLKEFIVETDSAYKKFQAQTGASAEEMAEFKEEMDGMYENAWGETLEDVGDKMAYIKQVTSETDPSKIRELAENAMTLEETFGSDFNETIRGVNNLMTHFGIDSKTAFDLFAKGSQEGLDYTGELGDNIAEYGGNFKQAGYTAEEYFQLLANGTENGAYNLDKVNDSINEVKNRLGDGSIKKNIDIFSKETKNAFEAWEKGEGTMKDVIDSIVNDINNCTDEQDALTMAATAFGTMGEDANLKVVKSLTTVGDQFKDVSGTMEDMKNIRYADVGTQFTELGRKLKKELLTPLAEKALPLFKDLGEYAIENIDGIGTALKILGGILGTVFVINKTATFITSLKTIATTLGLVKTSADVAAASTAGLNAAMLLNPAVLAVAGITALVGVLGYLAAKEQEATVKEYELSEAQQKTIDSATKLKNSYDEMNKSRNESMNAISNEYGYIDELKNEYNGLIGSNGKVKDGYEDRANFIINQLAQALGVEREEIQKNIDKNGQLGESIDKIIEKKKAEALLAANEAAYTEAIQKRNDALKTYQDSLTVLDETEAKYAETKKEYNHVMEMYNDLLKTSPETAHSVLIANSELINSNQQAKESYEKAKKAVEDSETAYVGYNATIQNYEGLSSAIISGDTEKIEVAMQNLQNAFITAETGTRESLEKQVANMQKTYEDLKKAIEEGTPGVTQAQVDAAAEMVTKAEEELAKLPPKAKAKGEESGQAHADGVKSKDGANKTAGKSNAENATLGQKEGASGANGAGKKQGQDHADGVSSKDPENKTAGKGNAEKAKEGMDSVDASSSGEFFGQGFINGLASMAQSAWNAGWNFVKNAWAGLKAGQEEGSPSKLTFRSGGFFVAGYVNAIAAGTRRAVQVARELAQKSVAELAKVEMPTLNAKVTTEARKLNNANGGNNGGNNAGKTVIQNFYQTNNSPKALNRLEIYRQTRNQLSAAKGV